MAGGAARGVVDALQAHVFSADLAAYGGRRHKVRQALQFEGFSKRGSHMWRGIRNRSFDLVRSVELFISPVMFEDRL